MAISIATAPAQNLAVLNATVRNWVEHPASAPATEHAGISFVSDEGINVHLPHPVYNLGLADIVAGKGLAAATLVSWRYLLTDGETTAMAEVAQASPDAAPAFAALNRGPFVASLVESVNSAQSNTTLQSGNYEIATLNIPALYVVALWLKSATPGGGTVLPLAPAPAFLTAGQHYTEAAFTDALLAPARASQGAAGAALV